jgi:hypothetical protein
MEWFFPLDLLSTSVPMMQGKRQSVSVFWDLHTKKKEPRPSLFGTLPIFAHDSRNSGLSTSCTWRSG